jgi:hypothetical protein
MNTLVSDALAKQVRFDDDTMWVDLDEDISVPALLLGVGDRTRKSAP